MKFVQIFFLLLVSGILTTAWSEQQVDSIIKLMPDGKIVARTLFRYDKRGYQTAAINYTFNKKSKKWVGTSSEEAIYDNKGNRTSKTTSIWNITTQKWMHSERESYRYDSEGRVTSVEQIKWDKKHNKWMGIMHTVTVYEDDGQISEFQTFEWNNVQDKWEYQSKIEYSYDAQRRKISELTQMHDDYGWYGVSRNEYEYAKKQISCMTNYTSNGKTWSPNERVMYTYKTSGGNKIVIKLQKKYDKARNIYTDNMRQTIVTDKHANQLSQKVEMYVDGVWNVTKHEKSIIRYDNDGNVIYNELQTFDGKKWIGVSKSETTYNSYGDVMTEKEMVWDDFIDDWKGIVNNEYDYDSMGNLSLSINFKWDYSGRKWLKLSKTVGIFDNNHNKISESTSSWDKAKNSWNEYYKGKFEYTYNGADEVTSMKEYVWNGEKWAPVATTLYY